MAVLQKLKDSGQRRATSTGAVRDRAEGKGRFDLIGFFGALSPALQMERGALKYSARNWEKGMPLSWFLDSLMRHAMKLAAGFDDEPHLDGITWNAHCLAEGKARIVAGIWPAEMDDLPTTYRGINPEDLIACLTSNKPYERKAKPSTRSARGVRRKSSRTSSRRRKTSTR